MVTTVLLAPVLGEIDVMVGGSGINVNRPLCAVFPPTVILIKPLPASCGMVIVNVRGVEFVTRHTLPFKVTTFSESFALNPAPITCSIVPVPPVVGLNFVMVRLGGATVSSSLQDDTKVTVPAIRASHNNTFLDKADVVSILELILAFIKMMMPAVIG